VSSLYFYPGAFCFAELGTVVKESGADYAYLDAAFGSFVSYSYSWVSNMLLRPASMATISLTCAQYITTSMFDDGCGVAPPSLNIILAICVLCTYFIAYLCHTQVYVQTYMYTHYTLYIEWVHALGVSFEIELKMDWQGCKQVLNCQILPLISQWD